MRTRKIRGLPGTRDPRISQREIDHRQIARLAAGEGIVLLENKNHFLPLAPGKAVALYGIGASRTVKGGTGSGDVNERQVVSIYEGMKNAGFRITNEAWIADFDKSYDAARLAWRDNILGRMEGEGLGAFFDVYSATPFAAPVGGPITKNQADTAFYILSRTAGEAKDRCALPGDYTLTRAEQLQLADVCRLYPHVVVVINAGGLIDLTYLDAFDNIEAVLSIVQPGMEGGNAFADVISGKVTPSGKLSDSWPYRYEDFPNSRTFSHLSGNVEKEHYIEGIYVGYRYFDTFRVPVKYGFGYGLSYTDFSVRFEQARWEQGTILVHATVTNVGNRHSGKEVVQMYATCPAGRLEKEFRRLVAFGKTEALAPGESQSITLTVSPEYLASYCEETPGWVLESGKYIFWLGSSLESAAPVFGAELAENVVLTKTCHICPLQEALEILHHTDDSRRAALLEKNLPVISMDAREIPQREVRYQENTDYVTREARAFVDKLSRDQLVALASGDPGKAQGGNLGAAGMTVPGSAGETDDCALEQGLASIVLADGPAGLRLNKCYNVHNGRILQKPFEASIEGGLFYVAQEEPGDRYYQYCTAIPVGTMLAQTWNEDLIRQVGQMVGNELEEFHVTLWLAPGMNIHRNPLCGRNFEYYSEDPVLSGKIAAAMTRGVQSVPGCGTTIKHFACNNQEDNRMNSDSILPERVLREIYLRGFEIAVREAQPMALMTSYNLINGVHSANNFDLCTRVLRSEWGFRGMIMTDWTTTEKGPDCTASGCMRAGNDLIMPGAHCDRENLRAELEAGTLDMEDLKACISRLVNTIWQSNQYEE